MDRDALSRVQRRRVGSGVLAGLWLTLGCISTAAALEPMCEPGALLLEQDAQVPANHQGVLFLPPGGDYFVSCEEAGFELLRGEQHLPLELRRFAKHYCIAQPKEGWQLGEHRMRMSPGCEAWGRKDPAGEPHRKQVRFEVVAPVPPPSRAGRLHVHEARSEFTVRGEPDLGGAELFAARAVDVELRPAAELRPHEGVVLYETLIDGQPQSVPGFEDASRPRLVGLHAAPRATVELACGYGPRDELERRVRLRAHLPLLHMHVDSEEVRVRLRCEDATSLIWELRGLIVRDWLERWGWFVLPGVALCLGAGILAWKRHRRRRAKGLS